MQQFKFFIPGVWDFIGFGWFGTILTFGGAFLMGVWAALSGLPPFMWVLAAFGTFAFVVLLAIVLQIVREHIAERTRPLHPSILRTIERRLPVDQNQQPLVSRDKLDASFDAEILQLVIKNVDRRKSIKNVRIKIESINGCKVSEGAFLRPNPNVQTVDIEPYGDVVFDLPKHFGDSISSSKTGIFVPTLAGNSWLPRQINIFEYLLTGTDLRPMQFKARYDFEETGKLRARLMDVKLKWFEIGVHRKDEMIERTRIFKAPSTVGSASASSLASFIIYDHLDNPGD